MRTVRVSISHRLSVETDLAVETEVILEDDGDAREAGREAAEVLHELIAGAASFEAGES